MGVSSQMGVSKNGNSLKFYEGIAWENYIKFFKKQWIGWREIVTQMAIEQKWENCFATKKMCLYHES